MPRKNEDDDEDEEEPFDFFKFFKDPSKFMIDPNKLFKDKDFKNLFQDIFNKILESLPPEFQNLSPEDIVKELMKNKSKFGFFPITYGFNVNIGPDGKPTIDSFGNLEPTPYSGKPIVKSKREPLVEVNEEEDRIIVIAEMPGVDREDIELRANSHSITISTKEDANRHYYKKVDLPSAINSDYAKARYSNGILEIELKKFDEKHTKIRID
ncbi:MAG: archaeal heat shock protein Hsp20 [Candidatus Hodarchaeota archaeon]